MPQASQTPPTTGLRARLPEKNERLVELAERADRRMEKCRKSARALSLADLEFMKNDVREAVELGHQARFLWLSADERADNLGRALFDARAELDGERRESERLKVERDEVASAAKRVGACLQQFMDDTSDPGTEALAAQYELNRILSLLSIDETVIGEAQYLSRFSATPSEIHRFLAKRLPEDVHLNYQKVIGNRAVGEAAKDLRMEAAGLDATLGTQTETASTMRNAANKIDPLKGGGPFPSELIRFGETGGAS